MKPFLLHLFSSPSISVTESIQFYTPNNLLDLSISPSFYGCSLVQPPLSLAWNTKIACFLISLFLLLLFSICPQCAASDLTKVCVICHSTTQCLSIAFNFISKTTQPSSHDQWDPRDLPLSCHMLTAHTPANYSSLSMSESRTLLPQGLCMC